MKCELAVSHKEQKNKIEMTTITMTMKSTKVQPSAQFD